MAQAQDDVMNEVMQMLEATPDTGPANVVPLVNDTPAKREKLAILVSTGKAKEAIGVQLVHVSRSSACRIKMWRSTTNGRKPPSAARQPSP